MHIHLISHDYGCCAHSTDKEGNVGTKKSKGAPRPPRSCHRGLPGPQEDATTLPRLRTSPSMQTYNHNTRQSDRDKTPRVLGRDNAFSVVLISSHGCIPEVVLPDYTQHAQLNLTSRMTSSHFCVTIPPCNSWTQRYKYIHCLL